jgi:hypothetical protein
MGFGGLFVTLELSFVLSALLGEPPAEVNLVASRPSPGVVGTG